MSKYDWSNIKLDYETGRFSFDALHHKYGAAKSTISRRAKQDGWIKGSLAQAAEQAVSAMAENTRIGALALTTVEITERHKTDIETLRNMLSEVGTRFSESVKPGASKEVMTKYGAERVKYNINDITQASKAFVEVLGKVHELERQAYGLDINKPADDDKTVVFEFLDSK